MSYNFCILITNIRRYTNMAGILLQVCLRHNPQDLLLSVYIGKATFASITSVYLIPIDTKKIVLESNYQQLFHWHKQSINRFLYP